MLKEKIDRCFDSHVHLFLTGELSEYLDLSNLKNPSDLSNFKPKSQNYREDWILGLGWDANKWKIGEEPTLESIDKIFSQNPVYFLGADAHTAWVNTKAIERVGLAFETNLGARGKVQRNSNGELTGIMVDGAMESFRAKIPKPNVSQLINYANRSLETFSAQGFLYLRDMTSNEQQWKILRDLEINGRLEHFIELFFFVEQELDPVGSNKLNIENILKLKLVNSYRLRIKGVKVFYDGALGSGGALMSSDYLDLTHKNCHHQGQRLLAKDELEKIMYDTWKAGLEISVHSLGDQAVHEVLEIANGLMLSGVCGKLHLEHVEILNPRSYSLIKEVKPTCHLQPSHFLADKHWLKNKVGNLAEFAFPWRALEELGIPFYFGSDSPVVQASLALTEQALQEAEAYGIKAILSDWRQRHSHPDSTWT
jgi:predicted amidohydrolase YtcJ